MFDFPNNPSNGQQVTGPGSIVAKRERLPYPCAFKAAYTMHKAGAKQRNIPFSLSLEHWKRLWIESGKWEQRGNRRGQYVMARFGDKGGYEIGNVRICLSEENRAERNKVYPLKGERNPHYGRNPWLTFKDPETAKQKKRNAMIAVAACRARNERGCFLPKESQLV